MEVVDLVTKMTKMEVNRVFWIKEGEHALGCCLNWKLDRIYIQCVGVHHPFDLVATTCHTRWCTGQTTIKFARKGTVRFGNFVCAARWGFLPLRQKPHPYWGDWRSSMEKTGARLVWGHLWVPGLSTNTGWKLSSQETTTGHAQLLRVSSWLLHRGTVSGNRVSQEDGCEKKIGNSWTQWTCKQGHCLIRIKR